MAALTTQKLYTRIKSLMGDNPWHDICTEAMDTTETGLDVADTTKYAIGQIVEFQDDGEQCLITALPSATTLTVIRNFNYSVTTTAGTGTNHAINGDIVVDPVVKVADITTHVAEVVTQLWPHVWKTPTTTDTDGPVLSITAVNGTKWYSLGSAYLSDFEIGHITQIVTTSPKKIVTYGDNRMYPVALQHGLSTSISTQFVGLYFWNIHNYDNPILVNLIQPITTTQTVAGTYDDIDDNTPAADALAYLVASRLVETTAITRLTQSDVTMGDATIGTNARLQLAVYLKSRGDQAVNRWAYLCHLLWPKLPRSRFFHDDSETGGKY